jgi:hypothetical protein
MVWGRCEYGRGKGERILHLCCECGTGDGSDWLRCIVGEIELVVVCKSLQLEEGLICEKIVGRDGGVVDGGHVNVVED